MDLDLLRPDRGRTTDCGTLILQRAGVRQVVASRTEVARGVLNRAVGLLKYRTMPEGLALIFPGCHSVHTVGMRFPIDLIFVDRAWTVVYTEPEVKPGRLIFPVRRAWGVVEAAAGTIRKIGLTAGDRLSFSP